MFKYTGQGCKNWGCLYYKHVMIVNDHSSVVNKMEALLTGDTRGVIYDRRVYNTGHCITIPPIELTVVKSFTVLTLQQRWVG
jgi:hypothetical protein